MKTSNEVKIEFITKLKELLEEYQAELIAEDHYPGYPECGQDIRITVEMDTIYTESGCEREYTEIDLGRYVYPDILNRMIGDLK